MMVAEEELRTRFAKAYMTLKAERKMREYVFRADPVKAAAKLHEMDECIETLVWMKDQLKAAGLVEPEVAQANLLGWDRAEYP